jgi:archaellum component FlaG (FlaF/FlaG flagellin family)
MSGLSTTHRLSNYQVSISDKADFSTHTYQQDFHVAPNPKKIIQLDASIEPSALRTEKALAFE